MNLINKQHILRYLQLFFILIILVTIDSTILPTLSWAQDGAISDIPFDNSDDDFMVDEEFNIDDDWDDYDEFIVKDPYEKYNRKMFNFNNKVYRYIFTPLSKGYDFLIPQKIQGSFNNLIRFATTPKRFFNNLFQKKFKSSFVEFERLIINGTIGIGGLFDPANRLFGLNQQTEDFGQTLGHYGVGTGPYIIWPIVGPSTSRDAFGLGIDTAFNVFQWFSYYDVESEDVFEAMRIMKRINNYSYNVRGNYERITDSAIDPYIALQHAYIKNRERNIKN